MKLESEVNKYLKKMIQVGGTQKGNYGEQAVLKICEEMYQRQGGILYHSYTYNVTEGLAGNIKRKEDGKLYLEELGKTTEIDILFATEFKIFPIEVKAYKSKLITITDREITGCFKTDKSPIHQNEMHCRHLYHKLIRALPEGASKYIEPIVVFVDECSIEDNRSLKQKAYIKVATLDTLKVFLKQLNVPSEYRLDLTVLDKCLRDACVSKKKYFPLRIL